MNLSRLKWKKVAESVYIDRHIHIASKSVVPHVCGLGAWQREGTRLHEWQASTCSLACSSICMNSGLACTRTCAQFDLHKLSQAATCACQVVCTTRAFLPAHHSCSPLMNRPWPGSGPGEFGTPALK